MVNYCHLETTYILYKVFGPGLSKLLHISKVEEKVMRTQTPSRVNPITSFLAYSIQKKKKGAGGGGGSPRQSLKLIGLYQQLTRKERSLSEIFLSAEEAVAG